MNMRSVEVSASAGTKSWPILVASLAACLANSSRHGSGSAFPGRPACHLQIAASEFRHWLGSTVSDGVLIDLGCVHINGASW